MIALVVSFLFLAFNIIRTIARKDKQRLFNVLIHLIAFITLCIIGYW
jgi:hypothetical protein